MCQTNELSVATVESGKQSTFIVGSAFCGNYVHPTQGIRTDLLLIENAINSSAGGNSTRKLLFKSVSGEVKMQN